MFVSLSLRSLINVEALNSVETVGNLSRHRSAPIIIPQPNGYTVKYVPAISGESIAHGYQAELVEVAKSLDLPVGLYSSRYEFIKFSEDDYLKDEGIDPPKDHNDLRRFEVDVLLKDVVADVGGFLYAGDIPVKRTSRIQVGYMIPALQDLQDATAVEAQFHVRYLFSKPQKGGGKKAEEKGKEEGAKLGQAIYHVEVASALYTLNINLDLAGIGVPSIGFGKPGKGETELAKQAPKRRRAALITLAKLLSNTSFGGRHSRFLPNSELRSSVIALADSAFIVSPGNYTDYVQRTWTRAEKYSGLTGHAVRLWCVNREGLSVPDEISKHDTIEGVFEELMRQVKEARIID
ncbi:MAG: type I-A CRISPR-associated protein Cas7/Csa2 [Nitrososphaerota archaeon]|nr:type I-A CRISPR-associated protein Cas7/Csa2 [Nitrososphaerota archaeon]